MLVLLGAPAYSLRPRLHHRAPAVQICSQALDVELRLMEGGSAHWVYHRNVDAGDGHGV